MPFEQLAADIPHSLHAADDWLTRYGRWAMWRRPVHHCASAEWRYIPSGRDALDARREPKEILLGLQDALACQRALARVSPQHRDVLSMLYVPKHHHGRRIPIQVLMRFLRLPPRLVREHHLHGLRQFDNLLRLRLQSAQPGRDAQRLAA